MRNSMDPERWQQIKSILGQALERSREDRPGFLKDACGPDAELRGDIDALLELDNTGANALEQDAFSAVMSMGRSLIGKTIGNYELLEELGSGGMGAVFLAKRADGAFDQKIALKVIKRGMDSDAILKRFVTERQILATLQHPNIAHLIDGGTTDDELPFFVMEYVDGEEITTFVDREDLSLEERLDLFREVCAAVSFAHANLVIHRDLKPSNILVTKDRNVKLLDFGIAKLLTSGTGDSVTATRDLVFTPEYASPEQIRGETLTTASDIYSLGVVLYELLAGERPFRTDSMNIAEIVHAVCESEPERPSSRKASGPRKRFATAASAVTDDSRGVHDEAKTNPPSRSPNPRSLRGDLDNIILKALRKEPERRYSSVDQFSDDIRRHLKGLPIGASRDTWNYRAGKFIARNRIAVASAALLVLALIAGVIGTTWQAVRAKRESERAERRFNDLRKISNSLVSEIERAIRDLPGSLPARQLLLTRAVEQLDTLAQESEGNPELQLELVWAYQNLGALPNQKLSERQATYNKALGLTEKALATQPLDIRTRDRLANLYLDLIYVSRLRGDVNYTVEYNRRAVEIVEGILRESPAEESKMRGSVWTVYYHQMLTMQQLGKAEETVQAARKILPIAEQLYAEQPPGSTGYEYMNPHLTRTGIGYGLNYAGDYEGAIKEFETALAECRAEMVKRPEADILKRNEANIRLQLATSLENIGDVKTALEHAHAALDTREKLAANNPKDLDSRIALADSELYIGQMLARQDPRRQQIVPRLRRALELYGKVLEVDEDRTQVKILLARTRASLGNVLASSGSLDEGIRYLRDAVEFYRSIGADTTIDAHLKRHYAEASAFLAAHLVKNRTAELLAEGRESYRKSLDLWRNLENSGTIRHSDASQPQEISRRLGELDRERLN